MTGQGGCNGESETALGDTRAPEVPCSMGSTRAQAVPYFLAVGSKSSGLRAAAVTAVTEPHESELPCNPWAEHQHPLAQKARPAVPVLLARAPQPLPAPGGCRAVAEPGHVLGSGGASSGRTASLVLPKRQLEFPEPAQHPRGKADSEQQPKNSCPGHTQPPDRRGSEKEGGLQLSKEQPQPCSLSSLCCTAFT